MAVAAAVPHPILNYSITIGNGKRRVAVWQWHVASWPTTNTTNAQAKSMATRTSCATSVATFGRAKAARRKEERHRGSSQDILSLWSFLLLPPQLVLSYYAAKNRNDVDSDSEGDVVRPVPAAARQTANETWRGCNGKPAIGFQLQTARGDATFQLNSSVCAHSYVCSASVCAPDLSTYLATTSPLLCLCTLSLLASFSLCLA